MSGTTMGHFPDKKYAVIYADPPWAYRDKCAAGKRGAGFKYVVQDIDWVRNLPVASIAAEDCALFLWITMPQLDILSSVLRAWGFSYKTVAFTWVKRNKESRTWFWGMGNWTRANAELCVLATRGKPTRVNASVHSVIDTPIRKHSQKPAEVRKRIEKLMGDVPKIELFAREKFEGWDAWGLEVDGVQDETLRHADTRMGETSSDTEAV